MTDPAFAALRVGLLQARATRAIELQEQTCFLERTRLAPAQLVPANVVAAPPAVAWLDGLDALMIGGAGEYSALDDEPWMPALLDVVRAAVDRGLPTFGSCWGHQVIARALGGTVVHDPARAELGCHPVELTPAGEADALFGAFPRVFRVNMGHHDRVAVLPPGGVELARNASQPNQAFRLADRPVYGTQFHSELDARRERERLIAYRRFYIEEVGTDAALDAVIASLADTSEVDELLHAFVTRVVLGADDERRG